MKDQTATLVVENTERQTAGSSDARSRAVAVELSVVVPTYNERENIIELINRLHECLDGVQWEVIFVDDDSADGTAEQVRQIACRDPRVRCIQRIGRRGLSSACTEGMLASSAPFLAIMDADCQHDERMLPRMLELLRTGEADIVVGSRYTQGGGIGNWDKTRARMSQFATRLSRAVIKQDLSDPMSGYFALRREVLESTVRSLSNLGFKILLDVLASSPRPLRLQEVPYEFRNRHAGESKLDSHAMWDYLMLLLDKSVGHIMPVRFIAFAIVGAAGVGLHFVVLFILFRIMGYSFGFGQATATVVAMTSNFGLNNALTFKDMRLRGWRWFKGWISFMLVCSIGAFANVGIASYLFSRQTTWALAAIAGIIVGAVWNYSMTTVYTWSKPGHKN